MNRSINKLQLFSYGITLLISLVILVDFILPGKVFTSEVIDVKKEKEQYYNAAGNYHFSYKITTSKHHFSVSEDFAKSAHGKKVQYSESLIFKEINRHRLLSTEGSTIYSLRILSGLILPLLVIIAIVLAYTFKKNISTLLFVLQVILILNLIYLLQ